MQNAWNANRGAFTGARCKLPDTRRQLIKRPPMDPRPHDRRPQKHQHLWKPWAMTHRIEVFGVRRRRLVIVSSLITQIRDICWTDSMGRLPIHGGIVRRCRAVIRMGIAIMRVWPLSVYLGRHRLLVGLLMLNTKGTQP